MNSYFYYTNLFASFRIQTYSHLPSLFFFCSLLEESQLDRPPNKSIYELFSFFSFFLIIMTANLFNCASANDGNRQQIAMASLYSYQRFGISACRRSQQFFFLIEIRELILNQTIIILCLAVVLEGRVCFYNISISSWFSNWI